MGNWAQVRPVRVPYVTLRVVRKTVRNWAQPYGEDGEEVGSASRESTSIDRGNVEHNPLGDIAAISDSTTALAAKGAMRRAHQRVEGVRAFMDSEYVSA